MKKRFAKFLEWLFAVLSIIGLLLAGFFSTSITGNTIGYRTSSILGLAFLAKSIIAGFAYAFMRKHNLKYKAHKKDNTKGRLKK